MKRGLRFGLIGAGAALAALVALPFLIPANVYKARIEEAVSRATGRPFTISGLLHISFLPTLAIRAEKIALANPPGFRSSVFAEADEARFDVHLWPLLAGRIEIGEVVLEKPKVHLEVDAGGRADWIFSRPKPSGGSRGGGGSQDHAPTANFPALRMEDGSVNYDNARSHRSIAFDGIAAAIPAGDLDRATSLTGSFVYRGKKVEAAVNASTPRALLEGRAAEIGLSLKSELLEAHFDGNVTPDGTLEGRAALNAASLRQAGAWLGAELPSSGGFEAFSLSAAIQGDNRFVALSDIKLALDGATMTGALSLDEHARTPFLRGHLGVDALDLNPYTERHREGGSAPRPKHEQEWSREPIALDLLHRFDADLTLDTGRLTLRDLALGRTRLTLHLQDAGLHAQLGPMALYGGGGTAGLDVDARGPVPVFRSRCDFERVTLGFFLKDTIGVKQIEGTGTIRLVAEARGASAEAIMHNLSGSGSLAFADGNFKGIDFGEVGRAIQDMLGAKGSSEAFTDYSALDASFRIANGVLSSDDLKLQGPLIQTTGSGTVDLGNRTIDFRIVPTASASLGSGKTVKIGVPFNIQGPWKHVRTKADIGSLVSGVIGNLASGKAPFKGLLGGKPPAPTDPKAPKKKHKNLDEALKNMLGIH